MTTFQGHYSVSLRALLGRTPHLVFIVLEAVAMEAREIALTPNLLHLAFQGERQNIGKKFLHELYKKFQILL